MRVKTTELLEENAGSNSVIWIWQVLKTWRKIQIGWNAYKRERSGGRDQPVKVCVTKPEDLSSSPRTNMGERTSQPLQATL